MLEKLLGMGIRVVMFLKHLIEEVIDDLKLLTQIVFTFLKTPIKVYKGYKNELLPQLEAIKKANIQVLEMTREEAYKQLGKVIPVNATLYVVYHGNKCVMSTTDEKKIGEWALTLPRK